MRIESLLALIILFLGVTVNAEFPTQKCFSHFIEPDGPFRASDKGVDFVQGRGMKQVTSQDTVVKGLAGTERPHLRYEYFVGDGE